MLKTQIILSLLILLGISSLQVKDLRAMTVSEIIGSPHHETVNIPECYATYSKEIDRLFFKKADASLDIHWIIPLIAIYPVPQYFIAKKKEKETIKLLSITMQAWNKEDGAELNRFISKVQKINNHISRECVISFIKEKSDTKELCSDNRLHSYENTIHYILSLCTSK